MLDPVELADIATEQVEALAAGGAEALWFETLSSQDEMVAAARAADCVGLPFVLTARFPENGRTRAGLSPGDEWRGSGH